MAFKRNEVNIWRVILSRTLIKYWIFHTQRQNNWLPEDKWCLNIHELLTNRDWGWGSKIHAPGSTHPVSLSAYLNSRPYATWQISFCNQRGLPKAVCNMIWDGVCCSKVKKLFLSISERHPKQNYQPIDSSRFRRAQLCLEWCYQNSSLYPN